MKLWMSGVMALLLLAGSAYGSWIPFAKHVSGSDRVFRDGCTPAILARAEKEALPMAAVILAQARVMTVVRHEILRGACWDYVDAVWNRAGYPAGKRRTIFRSKKRGPFAKAGAIQRGDWLYFVNHSYGNIEHSALFVDWADRSRLQAYLLSYVGEKRAEPARYKMYDLSGVYQIIRAGKAPKRNSTDL